MLVRMKKIAAFLLAIALTVPLAACSGKESNQILKYDISADPVNLDPQLVNDYASSLVVFNMMEGLLRINSEGKLTEGVAKDYDVSEDGLEYTFYLREDALWENGDSVTANDFVFAFKRLFDPQTSSPTAKNYYCIKNSKAVYKGKKTSDTLGVAALSTFVLKITLSYSNPMFLQLLTDPAAMPCNEAFFHETKGKYGLDADKTLANGPFVLNGWSHDDYLSLRRNTKYVSAREVIPAGVSFIVETENSQYRFTTERTDAFIFESADDSVLKKYDITKYENTVWGIAVNLKKRPFNNENITKALAASFDRSAFSESLPDSYRVTDAIVPGSITMLDKSYRDYASGIITSLYNLKNAKKLYKKGKKQTSGLNSVTLIASEGTIHADMFAYASQIWQKELSFYVKVETLEEDEYQSALESGDYDLAIVAISADYNSPEAILAQFTKGADGNIFGYSSNKYDKLLDAAQRADGIVRAAEYYVTAEKLVLSDGAFIPMYYQTGYFAVQKNVSDIAYYPANAMIDFAGARKK